MRETHGHIRSDRLAAHYAAADGANRVALLAHREGEIVAVAGYERLRELGAAEVAFAVLAGAGGRQAGLAGDVAFRLAPSTDVDADELLSAAPVVAARLDGARGAEELDREALAALVLRLTRLFEDVPELIEGDLNPVRVHHEGASVLDVRLRAGHRPAPKRIRTW